MESRKLVWFGIFVGGMVGAYIPELWGAGVFSFSSIIFSTLGAILGLWLGFKISQ